MRILVVEDDARLAQQLHLALESAGYAVDRCGDGAEANFLGETEPYDAVVLDLGLPTRDGLSVLRAWRGAGIDFPVIVLTARDSWHEKVEGIDAGADDYLAKPFRIEELLARVRAVLRRAGGRSGDVMQFGPIEIDTRRKQVTRDGVPVALTAHEYRVLAYLAHRAGTTVSRSELTEHIYAQDFDRDSNTLEVFVARLRRKLAPELIRTERGLGYRLDPDPFAAPTGD
ncbi:MAG: response regulator transcription factor [Gammaproteobacteria bacterium]